MTDTPQSAMSKAFELAVQDLNNYKRVHIGNEASCVVIINEDGGVLMASRRGKPTEFGLPGGKVDNGETLEEAAVRETYEETGILLSVGDLQHLITEDDGHGYKVSTYICTRMWSCSPIAAVEEDIDIRWGSFAQLIDGPFGEYNNKVYTAVLHWLVRIV